MKKIEVDTLIEGGHSLMNEVVMDTARELSGAHFVVKIDELLKERGITQKQLAQMTGMRVGTISDIVNGKGSSINKAQLFSIMVALKVTRMSDIYEVVLPEEKRKDYLMLQDEWVNNREMPVPVKEMYKKNVLKASGLSLD
ncbi:helix-turn-helix transcriptional regulator [Rossellomorea marisflavi]|jgi:transcriptional regulator with XRE-family HTH domain|uniref:helix-turn-helix domain-containing protein n=1 Tax=Rossellomorea marisflavi TaxID=189381 RepID=UPI003D285294